MKICSLCNRTYDDRVDFCFAEGEPLGYAAAQSAGEPRPTGRKVSTLVPVEATSAPSIPQRNRPAAGPGPDPTIIPEDDEDIGPVYLPEETAPVAPEPRASGGSPSAPEAPRRPPTLGDEFEISGPPPTLEPDPEGEDLEGPAPVEFPRAQPGRVPAAQRPNFRPSSRDALMPHQDDESEERPRAAPVSAPEPSEQDEEAPHGPYWGRIAVAALLLLGLVGLGVKALMGDDDKTPPVAQLDGPPTETPPPVVEPPTLVEAPPVVEAPQPTPAPVEEPIAPPVVATVIAPEPPKPVPTVTPTPPTNPVVTPPKPPVNTVTTPSAPAVAALRINVSPADASVSVDGSPLAAGASSWSGAPGRHLVSVRASGYKPAEKSVDLAAGGGEVSLTLEREAVAKGMVKLYGTMGTSQVYVGDQRIDVLPAQIELNEGSHTFRVVMQDQSSYTVQRTVKFSSPGQPVTISLAPN